MSKSDLEQEFAWQMKVAGLKPECEYRFHNTRRWRWDFCFPEQKVAVEVEGGGFVNGRHTRGAGLRADCEKANEATLLGWKLLRITDRHIKSGQALAWLRQLLEGGAA